MPATYKDNGGSVNGSNKVFTYDFPTLQTEDVKVALNGVTQATTKYTVSLSPANITFNNNSVDSSVQESDGSPKSGVTVRVYRETTVGKDTGDEDPKAVFAAGSSIRASDLNANVEQALFGIHEQQDKLILAENINTGAVTSAKILDDTIVNADVNASAAIAGTKVSPNFGSQAVITSGTLAAGATTVTGNITVSGTVDGRDVATDGSKLDGIEAGATGNQTNTEIRAAVEAASDSNVFTDADHTKLNAIEAGATADQTNAEIRTAVEAASDSNVFTDADHSKLNAIEASATADQTDGEIKTAYENNSNTNAYTDAEKTKLSGIEASATADQSISEIKSLIAGSPLDSSHLATDSVTTSELADAELTTLAGMQSGTASKLASGTALTADIADLNQVDGLTKQTTISDSDASFPTSGAVVDYVAAQIAPIGGLEVIATEVAFPNTQPQAGVVISIADAGGIVVNGSGVSTTGRTVGGSTVTINGINSSYNSSTVTAGVGFLVSSTGSGQIYDFHKSVIRDQDILSISTDINDFANRYRVGSSNPTSSLDDGDMFFNTSTGKMMVYNATNSAWEEVQSIGNFYINTISSYSGTGGNNATFNGSAYRFVLSNAPTNAEQLLVSINGVVQKPNSGTSQPSEGFAIDGSSIIFSSAPPTGSDYFIITIGSTVNIGTPSNNTVSTAILQNGSVTTDKLGADAVTGAKIADDAVGSEHIEVLDAALQFGDSVKAQFGAGPDLDIYSDGTNAYIQCPSTGNNLIIESDNHLWFKTGDGDFSIKGLSGSGVELYHHNVKKLETVSGGINVVGYVNVQSGGHVYLEDSGKLMLGTSSDLQIYHDGSNYGFILNNTGDLVIKNDNSSTNAIRIRSKGDEEDIVCNANGAVELYYDNGKVFETTASGAKVNGILECTDHVKLGDNDVFVAGSGDDLQIYHDGSHSYISDTGEGYLIIKSSEAQIQSNAGEDMAKFIPNGAVELYYDNVKKLNTASWGVNVVGQLSADTVSLGDGEKLLCGASDDMQIFHDGSYNYVYGSTPVYVQSNTVELQSQGGEKYVTCVANGAVGLHYDNAQKLETLSNGIGLDGDSSSCALRLRSNSSIRGYFYADANSSTGHLDNSGSWKFRVENDGDYQFYGSSISDRDKKDNITTVTGTSLDKLTKLVPKTYNWKNLDGITPTDRTFTGFIAQEVKEHLPSLVTGTDGQKNMAVDYNGILAYAVKAITELSTKIETLETKVAALEAK